MFSWRAAFRSPRWSARSPFTLYAAARTIPLALFAIHRQSAKALLVLGALAGIVQLLDAGVGAFQGDVGKTIGPLVIAGLQFVSAFFLARIIDPDLPEQGRGLQGAPALTSLPGIAKKRALRSRV